MVRCRYQSKSAQSRAAFIGSTLQRLSGLLEVIPVRPRWMFLVKIEEHESGPEILVYLAVTAAGLNLPAAGRSRWDQGLTAAEMRRCRWVKPVIVCQVKFTEWTRDDRLRHPVFPGNPDRQKCGGCGSGGGKPRIQSCRIADEKPCGGRASNPNGDLPTVHAPLY